MKKRLDFAALLGLQSKAQVEPIDKHVEINAINVLAQMRKTFEGIEDLAATIERDGLLEPIIVARYTPKGMSKYLEVINTIHTTTRNIEDCVAVYEKGKRYYYVLVAGERRLRASMLLISRMSQRQTATISARVLKNESPVRLLFLQCTENSYRLPPPQETARTYASFWRLVRSADASYPKVAFAERLGCGVEKLNRALLFIDLPVSVQDWVDEGKLSYGHAIELARASRELGLPSTELLELARTLLLNPQPVEEWRKKIAKMIFDHLHGQGGLFGDLAEYDREGIRRVVEERVIRSLWAFLSYWRVVCRLFEDGSLGQSKSPFSEGSPLRLFRELLQLLKEEVNPHLRSLLSSHEQEEVDSILRESEALSEVLSGRGE